MASSRATTVSEYLDELPPERREVVSAVRDVVAASVPAGVREVMAWGMITWEIPLERFPDTYNGKPLMYAALAAQKNHYALYLMTAYGDGEEWIRGEYAKAGRKLDMGKSCVRFRRLDDVPLDIIADAVSRMTVDEFIAVHEASRSRSSKPSPRRRT